LYIENSPFGIVTCLPGPLTASAGGQGEIVFWDLKVKVGVASGARIWLI